MESTQNLKQRKLGVQSFEGWKRSVEQSNHFLIQRAKRDKESTILKIQRLGEEIEELREQLKKPLPEADKITKEEYIAYFEKSKKEAEESEDWIWVGGDKPVFEGGEE